MAACHMAECRGMSQGRCSGGTMSAGNERDAGATKARATPKPNTIMKMGPADVGRVCAYQASPAPATASPMAAIDATRRRSKRSATDPVTRTSSAAGATSARPRSPRSTSRPVRSYPCLPSAVTPAMAAVVAQNMLARRAAIDNVTFGRGGAAVSLNVDREGSSERPLGRPLDLPAEASHRALAVVDVELHGAKGVPTAGALVDDDTTACVGPAHEQG